MSLCRGVTPNQTAVMPSHNINNCSFLAVSEIVVFLSRRNVSELQINVAMFVSFEDGYERCLHTCILVNLKVGGG